MKGCLRSKDGSSVYQLRNAITTIGREGSDITLPFSSIEKQHAIVEFDDSQGCFILQDLNSANGTYVNEHRVQNSAVRLAPGDIIRFGFGNPGYEFGIDQIPSINYQSLNPSRPWMSTVSPSQCNTTSLPYITTGLSSIVDSMPVFQGSQSINLPNTGVTSDVRGFDSWGGGVMPHPPLRSRPASAGTTKPRPGSAGREHPPMMSRGGWLENGTGSPNPNGKQTVEDLEERLLRMGDELSRLASYETECHRKDGVINSLRDEVANLKSKLGSLNYGFRGGGEESAFTNIGIVSELRQQNSQLQALLKEKDETHRTVTQKLTSYQEQLHIKNEELNTLKQQLDLEKSTPIIKVKQDPNDTTNTLASLRTQLAERDRKIAQLSHDLDKANKQKAQTSKLLNSLQRDNSAKDSVVQQAKSEIEKLKKQLREKDVTISTISAKLTRQKASKEAEMEADKRERELTSNKDKLQSTEKQLKDRTRQVSELQDELDRVRKSVNDNRQVLQVNRRSTSDNTRQTVKTSIDTAKEINPEFGCRLDVLYTVAPDMLGSSFGNNVHRKRAKKRCGEMDLQLDEGILDRTCNVTDAVDCIEIDSVEAGTSLDPDVVGNREGVNHYGRRVKEINGITTCSSSKIDGVETGTALDPDVIGDGEGVNHYGRRVKEIHGITTCSSSEIDGVETGTALDPDGIGDGEGVNHYARKVEGMNDRRTKTDTIGKTKGIDNCRLKTRDDICNTNNDMEECACSYEKWEKELAEIEAELEKHRQLARMLGIALRPYLVQSDRSLQQELDHAKAQFLDANRAEKLLKVDMQQLEKRFDRFRKKAIQNIFMGGKKTPANRELDDDELLDHIKDLSQENVKLVDEIREYAEAEKRAQVQKTDLKEAMSTLRKDVENIERHLSKYGRGCKTIEEELTKLEELHTHDSLLWVKDVMSRLLTNEMSWQKRSEETMKRAGVDVDGSDGEEAPTVDDLCRQLKTQRDNCKQLQAKIAEMEETHQEVILKLREDAKQDEERKIARAVAEVKTDEQEKQHDMMQEMRVKEQERIREAVETERRILESQHGSVTQLQQTLTDKEHEINRYRSALAEAKSQYEQAKKDLIQAKESENKLVVQLQETVAIHETQMNKVIKEREDLRNYKQEEVASFKEQTRQHARTIVAMEDRLLLLTKQNKQLEIELAYHKQTGGKHRPSSPRKDSRSPSPRKDTNSRPQSPKKEPKQTRSVETETIPQTNVEASLKSDVFKLEQLVLLLRREASQAQKEAQGQADVVQALRRDLAGASARMSDMAGELSDKQKQKLEENEERIRQQDKELEEQKKQLMQLSLLVDEQQKEIEVREEKLSEHQISFVKHQKDAAKKGSQLVEYTEKLVEALEDKEAEIETIEKESKNASDLYKMGVRCRGERHDQVILRQKEALMDLRKKTKIMEQLKPPLPSHEQSLQQIIVLKNELAELRASIANKEEDYHKTESEMHAEEESTSSVTTERRSAVDNKTGSDVLETREITLQRKIRRRLLQSGSQVRLLREQSSSNLVETNFEKSSHKQTKEALDLSEKTYLKFSRTLASLLEVDPIPGNRSMAHIPVEEREKLEQEREKALELLTSRIKRLYERLERKEKLLGGYEDDLLNLRQTQSVAGQKTAEAKGLKIDVRGRQEEIAYLRESLSRMRDELDQQRRLNRCLQERKKFAMDYEDRDHHGTAHSCYENEFTRHQSENKRKKAAEKLKRKNYEIESLKKELLSADRELNSTALKLQALESSRGVRSDMNPLELEDI